jgi:hypothetical protein
MLQSFLAPERPLPIRDVDRVVPVTFQRRTKRGLKQLARQTAGSHADRFDCGLAMRVSELPSAGPRPAPFPNERITSYRDIPDLRPILKILIGIADGFIS